MDNFLLTTSVSAPNRNINVYVADGVDNKFKENTCETLNSISCFSKKAQKAVANLRNVIVLKDSMSVMPAKFARTKHKLNKHASDAYGFVCKTDKAIVINEHNHKRKDVSLEGSLESQVSDTLSHEIGHLIDKNYSTSPRFVNAYLKDLKNIEQMIKNGEKVNSREVKDMVVYLKHYMEGADFSDGIDRRDVSREGLRENFAECFSTIVDEKPSEINDIFKALFPNTMAQTLNFVI